MGGVRAGEPALMVAIVGNLITSAPRCAVLT